jgi:hypothetical protein
VAWDVWGVDKGFYTVKKDLHILVAKKFTPAGLSYRYADPVINPALMSASAI